MTYNIYFNISAVMITGVVLIADKVSRWIPTNKNRFYKYLVLAVFSTALCDLFACLMEMYPMNYAWWRAACHLFSTLNFSFHIATGMCSLLFVLSLANINAYHQKNRLLVVLGVMVSTIMLGINCFWPVYFYYDAHVVYQRGPLFWMQYAIGIYYLAMILFVMHRYRKAIGENNRRVILAVSALVCLGILLQTLRPGFLIGEFMNALGVILIYVLVENADEIRDERYGILSRNACLRMAELNVNSDAGFKMIFIHLSDSRALTGRDQIHSDLVALIIAWLLEKYREEAWICRWSDNCLVMDLNGRSEKRAYEIMNAIEARFREPWTSGDYSQTIGVCMWLIRCPEDVKTVRDLTRKIELINSIGISKYRGILNLEEMDFSRENYRLSMVQSVQPAIKKHAAKVLYEPVYSTAENRFISARSIIFFPDKDGHMVNGNDFVNASDTSALLSRLDEYVFEDAAKNMKFLMKDTGLKYVSSRLSFSEVLKPGFENGLKRRCERYDADYRNFLLRVSGGTQVNLPKEGLDHIRRMKEEGWNFAMDDFGYGISILDRMSASEISMVILHPEVSREVLSGDDGVMMGCGLIYTVHGLGKQIAMTAIRSQEEAELAKNIGADYLCGPYLCPPMPAEELAVWLKERNGHAVQ